MAEYAHTSCINYAKSITAILSTLKCWCIISRNARNDVPDKWQRDGIGGEASVNVAAVDNKPLSAPTDAVSAIDMEN